MRDPDVPGYEARAVTPVRVLVVASNGVARTGLRAMLAEVEGYGIEVVGEVAALAEPEGELALAGVDVVVASDEELLEDAAHALDGEGALVLVSGDAGAVGRVRELPSRGWGVVPEDARAEELGAAVLAVASGLAAMPVSLAAGIAMDPLDAPAAVDEPIEPLTPREGEVLGLLALGMSNKMVSCELHISEHTVKFHISSLYAKLGVGNRAGAVSVGARRGLISL